MEVTSDTDETAQGIRSSDRVVMRSIAALTPYAANARTHSPEQIAQIARSIVEFGFTNPVLVDADGGIIAGHGRVLAAASLDMVEVPTLDVHWLTPEQRRAYVIADNKLALNAGWDNDLLAAELGELMALEFNLDLVGFDDAELGRLLAPEPRPGGPMAEWGGMPTYTNEDKTAFQSLRVHFQDEAALLRFAAFVGQPITPKTAFLWYPHLEQEIVENKAWITKT